MRTDTQNFTHSNIVVPHPTRVVPKAPLDNKVALAIATSIRKRLRGEGNRSFSRPYIEELSHLYQLRHFNFKKGRMVLPNVPSFQPAGDYQQACQNLKEDISRKLDLIKSSSLEIGLYSGILNGLD